MNRILPLRSILLYVFGFVAAMANTSPSLAVNLATESITPAAVNTGKRQSAGQPIIAEVVWFESAKEGNRLYYGWYNDDHWQRYPRPLVSSKNALATPVLATKPSGQKVLFWSETNARGGMDLWYKTSLLGASESPSEVPEQWSTAKVLSSLGNFNLGASAIVDLAGRVWVFWSADYYDSSDVFMMHQTNSGWTTPELVHQANAVPDNNIQLSLSEQGEVIVRWQSLDLEQLVYVEKREKYAARDSTDPQTQLESRTAKEDVLDEAALPEFVPMNQRLIIHFPRNRQHQSKSAR